MSSPPPPPPPPSSLCDLPEELLLAILRYMLPPAAPAPVIYTLYSLVLSCRKLYRLATPFLDRSAVLLDMHDCAVTPADLSFLPLPRPPPATSTSPAPAPRCHLLLACATGNVLLVQRLADAATGLATSASVSSSSSSLSTSSSPPPLPLLYVRQAYLTTRFRITTNCPVSHWSSFWPDVSDILHLHSRPDLLPPAFSTVFTTALHTASQNGHANLVSLLLCLLDPDNNSTNNANNTNSLLFRQNPLPAPLQSVFPGTVASTCTTTASTTTDHYLLTLPHVQEALDAPAPLACLCPSRHMPALVRSAMGLGRAPGMVSDPLRGDWPDASPLMLAVAHRHSAVARQLIAAGATWSVPISPTSSAAAGVTALHMIAANNMVDLAEWLVEWCKEEEKDRDEAWRPRRRNRVFWDWPDGEGRFALHYISLSTQRPSPSSAEATIPTPTPSSLINMGPPHEQLQPTATPDHRRLMRALVSLGADPNPGSATIIEYLRYIQDGQREISARARETEKVVVVVEEETKQKQRRGKEEEEGQQNRGKAAQDGLTASSACVRSLPPPRAITRPCLTSPWRHAPAAFLRRHQIRYWDALSLLGRPPCQEEDEEQDTNDDDDDSHNGDTSQETTAVTAAKFRRAVRVEEAFHCKHLDLLQRDLDGALSALVEAEQYDEAEAEDGLRSTSTVLLALAYENSDLAAELVSVGGSLLI